MNTGYKQLTYSFLVICSMCLTSATAWAEEDSKAAELSAQVKEIFRTRCFECHGGSKTNAGVKILERDVLVEKEMVEPGNPEDSPLYQRITADDESIMPPEGQPRLSASDIDAIRRWISGNAKAFPEDVAAPKEQDKDPALKGVVGVDYVLKQILKHVQTVPGNDRPYYRYFSINHLLAGGTTRAQLDLQRDALAKAINHLSKEPTIAQLEVLDDKHQTIFAVDIRKLGWHRQPFQRIRDGRQTGSSSLNLFDLVLLEYPYGTIYEDSETYDRLVEQYIKPAGLVRPVIYVRADWFVSTATQPPLYEDLLQLPVLLSDLEAELGIDSESNIKNGIAKRAGMTVSGVSRNNRVVERHPARNGAYWKSFDFSSSKGQENMFKDPMDLHPAGGEMIFNLPNGLQAYFLADKTGRKLAQAPTSIVTDKFAEDKTVRNGLSCIRCHDRGMKTFADTVRPAVERLSGSPGFSRRDVLRLYTKQKELDDLLKSDTKRFLDALEMALGDSKQREPLIPVTQRFLDAPLQLSTARAELGLADASGLKFLFRTPKFVSLGLIPLASQGIVRRDMWEDYYDDVVRQLGLGIPILPIDGLTRPDFEPVPANFDVKLSTSKKNNVFAPGDELVVFVKNTSQSDLHIELIGTSATGRRVILAAAGTVVKSGATFRFPKAGSLKVQAGLGKEQITLFACDQKFPAGELLRGKHLSDRFVHPFYPSHLAGGVYESAFDPSRMVKKTLTIETR